MQVRQRPLTDDPAAATGPVREVAANLRKIVRIFNQESRYMQTRFGLTGPQAMVLSRLATSGPLSSAELSRSIHVTPANMTGIIDRLEAKGLLQRLPKPGDRRISVNTLTDKGLSLGLQLADPVEEALSAFMTGEGDPVVAEINSALTRLARLLEPIFKNHRK